MVDIMQLLEGGAYISFIIGAVFAVWQLYEIRKDRRTQLLLNFMETSLSPINRELARSIWEKEFKDGKEAEEKCGREALASVCVYYEGLGYLLRRKLIDRKSVFEVYGNLGAIWKKLKPWILSQRVKENDDPTIFEHFEYAAKLEHAYQAKKKRKGFTRGL